MEPPRLVFVTMTKPQERPRNRIFRPLARYGPILAILMLATALRLNGVAFGLPSLNDPDEPLFMLTAFDMVVRHSANPAWFGHPGTTTLYCLALVIVLVGATGTASGKFADPAAFAAAIYHDPGIVFLPARIFIVLNGVLCVWLAYRIGTRLWSRREGTAAALILAVNAIHVSWSQVIRTDIQASVFMQLCVLCSIAIMHKGKRRDLILAGVFGGLAVATKWPAAMIVLCPIGAAAWRVLKEGEVKWTPAVPLIAALVTLVLVSPFLVLDYETVIRDLSDEARVVHPGATGGGLIANLAWYAGGPLRASLGLAGCALALGGAIVAAKRDRAWLVAVCPGYLAFALVITTQHLIWERWLVPLMPFLALAAGWSAIRIADAAGRFGFPTLGRIAIVALPLALAAPMLSATFARAVERQHDTRQIATAWVRSHVPAGSTILVEHAAFDLLNGPYRVIFPLGSAGCVDAREMLTNRFSYSDVESSRSQAPVIDLGHVGNGTLDSCRADVFVLSNFDRYRRERGSFSSEYRKYTQLLRGSTRLYTVSPRSGVHGGPEVQVWMYRHRSPRPVRTSG